MSVRHVNGVVRAQEQVASDPPPPNPVQSRQPVKVSIAREVVAHGSVQPTGCERYADDIIIDPHDVINFTLTRSIGYVPFTYYLVCNDDMLGLESIVRAIDNEAKTVQLLVRNNTDVRRVFAIHWF